MMLMLERVTGNEHHHDDNHYTHSTVTGLCNEGQAVRTVWCVVVVVVVATSKRRVSPGHSAEEQLSPGDS
jgi:hypothetical protein